VDYRTLKSPNAKVSPQPHELFPTHALMYDTTKEISHLLLLFGLQKLLLHQLLLL
jgi:hypothetical protein